MHINKHIVISIGLGLLILFFIPLKAWALSRSDLLFYADFDKGTGARFSRGDGNTLPGYQPAFIDGISGRAAVVSAEQGIIKTLKKPIPFWLDVGILTNYTDENIGALRYSQKGNMDYREGTLSFWLKAVDWRSGGKDRYLAHFNMEDTLSFIWAPYPGWLEFRQSRISNRDEYKKFASYPSIEQGRWQNVIVAWRDKGKEIWQYMDGVLRAHTNEGVPGYPGPGSFFALGDARKWHTAFDNVLVLARAVTPVEAATLYQQGVRQEDSIISIPKISQPPVIDGKFNPSEWKGATQLTGWSDTILGVANDDKTVVYTAYDDKNLYVCFRWPIPEEFLLNRTKYVGTPLKRSVSKLTSDEKSILNDDHFSLNIKTAKGSFFFAVNGNGAVYDAKNGDTSWNGHWKYSMNETDKFWSVELVVPWASITNNNLPVQDFGINFGHSAFQVKEVDSIWAFNGRAVVPLAQVRLRDSAPIIKVEKFNNPSSGELSLEAEIYSRQPKELKIFFGLDVPKLSEDKQKKPPLPEENSKGFVLEKTVKVAAREMAKITFSKQLETPVAGTNYLRIEDKDGQILFSQRRLFAYSLLHGIKVSYVPTPDIVLVDIRLGSYRWLKEPLSGTLKVVSLSEKPSSEKKTVMQLKVGSFDSVKKTIQFSAAKLPVGKYEVQLSLSRAGRKLSLVSDTFEKKPLPVWYNNKIGEADTVPAPWTPIEIGKKDIKVWGRSYGFTNSLLPSQIYSQGKKILSGPINLKIFRDGKWESISAIKTVIEKPKNERATIKARGVAGSLQIENSAWLEFDGFSWYKITVSPEGKKGVIDGLILEIPFSKKIAKLWYSGRYRPDSPTGYLPQKHYLSNPVNFVRIGDPDIGLQWCWQSLQGWNLKNPDKAMEFIPGKDSYIVRFHIIDHRTEFSKPFSFSFGLQALPARPVNPPGFRRTYWGWSRNSAAPSDFDKVQLYNRGWSPQLSYLNLSEAFLRKRREALKKRWEKERYICAHYLNLRIIDGKVPEYKYFQEEWRPVPSNRPDIKGKGTELTGKKNYILAPVSFASKSYQDFYVYYLDKFMREMTKDSSAPIGLYFDNAAAVTDQNPFNGIGYVDSTGKRQPELAILPWREAMKRIYRVTKKYGQKNWITVHMSGQPHMAYWSFADVLIPGEQFASYFVMKKAREKEWPYNYTKMLSLPRMRAEFTPYDWGGGLVFLSEIWNFAKNQPEEVKRRAADHFFGICFVNDTMTWGAGWAKGRVLDALSKYFAWDDDVVFHPYWNNQELISLEKFDIDKVVASLFTNHKYDKLTGKGKFYLMVFAFNDTDEEVSTGIKLNLSKLHMPEYRNGFLWDPLSDKKFYLSQGKGNITIPARNFRMLFLKK